MNSAVMRVDLQQVRDYVFDVQFPDSGMPSLIVDEPAPLGSAQGPDPARLLGTAVGNCMAASLLFTLRKYHNGSVGVRAQVLVNKGHNADHQTRILGLEVSLTLDHPAAGIQHLDQVLAQFEHFCVVTQSIRPAIPVLARVVDQQGVELRAD